MLPSSRTPEGEPNRCHVCGHKITIEPSVPPGDAPCPCCNSLLWFEPEPESSTGPMSLKQTQQQIRELTNQIAALVDVQRAEAEFYERFLKLLMQSLVAPGGAVWKVERKKRWLPWQSKWRLTLTCQRGLPQRLLGWSPEAAAHNRLLSAIANAPEPFLIPPETTAGGMRQGTNPTHQLLLIQPLGDLPRVRAVLEIFCRPVANATTARGYQRFVMEMCEFEAHYHQLRTDSLVAMSS